MTIQNTISSYFGAGSPGQNNLLQGKYEVINSGEGATRTLLAKESGMSCLFDKVDGIVYTLPAPVVGMRFKFFVKNSITSNSAKVQTDAATTFLIGGINMSSLTAGANDFFVANGSSHVGIALDSSTKGGLVGGYFEVVCISATLWQISGVVCGSGALADPFV